MRRPRWFGTGPGQFPGPSNRITALEGATNRSTLQALAVAAVILILLFAYWWTHLPD